MSKVREEVIAFFDDECLTNCYRFIVDEYSKMIQATRRYDLCPYQYAQFVIAAITFDAKVGLANYGENDYDLELQQMHRGISGYPDIVRTINEYTHSRLMHYLKYTLSQEFADLWCGPLMYTNLELTDISGTYEKPIFEFTSRPHPRRVLTEITQYLKNNHHVVRNYKKFYHGSN